MQNIETLVQQLLVIPGKSQWVFTSHHRMWVFHGSFVHVKKLSSDQKLILEVLHQSWPIVLLLGFFVPASYKHLDECSHIFTKTSVDWSSRVVWLVVVSHMTSRRESYAYPQLVSITFRPIPIDADLSWSFYDSLRVVIRSVMTSIWFIYNYLLLVAVCFKTAADKHWSRDYSLYIETGHVTVVKSQIASGSHHISMLLHQHGKEG